MVVWAESSCGQVDTHNDWTIVSAYEEGGWMGFYLTRPVIANDLLAVDALSSNNAPVG